MINKRNLICVKDKEQLELGELLLYEPYKNILINFKDLCININAKEFDPISKEINKNEHRSFAQTTRFELGEYFLYGKDIKDFKIIIGADKSFSGIKYIEYKYKQKYSDFKLYNDFDLAINEVKKILNK